MKMFRLLANLAKTDFSYLNNLRLIQTMKNWIEIANIFHILPFECTFH